MTSGQFDFSLAIGGEAGQGIATPGDILTRLIVRRGLHLNTFNAFQSLIRGGHIFLTIRIGETPVYSYGDRLDMLICLNQDTMDRHLRLMGPGTRTILQQRQHRARGGRRGCPSVPHPHDRADQDGSESSRAEHGGPGRGHGAAWAGIPGA